MTTGSDSKPQTPRRRTGLVGAIVALGLLGTGALLLFLPHAPPVATETAPTVKDTPSTAPAPTPKRISITTLPPDAEVMNGPERLGRTPLVFTLRPDTAPFDVTVAKKGFREQRLRIRPDRDREFVIELAATDPPSGATRSTPEPPAPSPPPPAAPRTPRELKDVTAD